MDGARLAQEVAAASSALASLGKLPRPNSAAGLAFSSPPFSFPDTHMH